MGEWPVLVQGTFSIWSDAAAVAAYARGEPDHARVIERTRQEGWYTEELFARFAITGARGSWLGEGADTVAGCPPRRPTAPSSAS